MSSPDAPTHPATIGLWSSRLTSTRDERIGFVVSAVLRVRPASNNLSIACRQLALQIVAEITPHQFE